MRAFLLAGESDIFLAIAIFCLIVAIGVIMGSVLKKKLDYSQSHTKGARFEGQVRVNLHKPFIAGESFRFYNALQRALPVEFIAFPNIGVDTIVKPAGDLVTYNAIGGKYLDFVIFKKEGMVPSAVVDLIDPGVSLTSISKQHEVITKTLRTVNLPVLEFMVDDVYNEKDILTRFLDSQDAYTIAMLKKQRRAKNPDEDYE
ncbi:MAG: DUF2726 domain-containing protein [Clostridia bacterium]|nr:DUF2726 domain-containing protein [Clostridia bacterium]